MLISKKKRAELLKNTVISWLSSPKIAVICFVALGILIVAGTIYQSEYGLYQAQEKFFNSWISFIGPIPVPSAKSIMWLLFINLSFALIFRFNYSWKNLGLIISHLGIIFLLVSGFLTDSFSQESFLKLQEGESSNISEDYYQWQIKVRSNTDNSIKTFNLDKLEPGDNLTENIRIEKIYKNAKLFETPFAGTILKELETSKEYEANIPALILEGNIEKYLEAETRNFIQNDEYSIILQRKKYQLPFSIKLIDVSRDLHPGTEIAKSYKSHISVTDSGLTRELNISMNKPFRTGAYTAFQAGYGIDQDSNEFTVLAIVENSSYSLAYWATLIASLGLFINFFQNLFSKMRSKLDE
jgi:hypothetical protein